MSLGRRKVRLEDEAAWVFNRMVDAYQARPAYPPALLDALSELAPSPNAKIGDIGAGIGHLALPLASRGFDVTAVEPARQMLRRLETHANEQGLNIETIHGQAESMPVRDGAFDLVVIADAVHFLDSERASYELKRVLSKRGALALITCEFTPTPFMRALAEIMHEAAPRRPRNVISALKQLLAVSGVKPREPVLFEDETPLTSAALFSILRSISFIGPAMNPERTAAFQAQLQTIEYPAVWSRTFTLSCGLRAGAG